MLLDRSQRQMVVFNPANKEHRNHYAEFLKNKSWGKCPVRFETNEGDAANNNLAYTMQRLLTEYYISKEFAGK